MSNVTGNQSATNVRRFKPYPAYKDTGVEWLGKVPEKWEIKRIRTILRDSDGIKIGPFGSSLKSEVIQATGYKVYGQEHVINGDFQLGEKYVDENKFNELCACEISAGDLVVSMMGTTGKCQVVPCDIERGIMDSHLLRIRPKATIHPQLLARLINESDYVRFQVSMNSKGAIMEGLNSSIIKNLALLLPSLDEQLIIETFLDRETARIDQLIAKKELQIELLQEKRSALISHAVTKGLNPKAKMKDSRIGWLGEIPEHWELKKFKFLIDGGLVNGLFKKKDHFGTGVRLVNVFDIYRDNFLIDNESLDRVEAEPEEVTKYGVQPGDIFFVRSSLKLEGVGRSVCASEVAEPTVFECHVVRGRPNQQLIVPRYLINYLNSVFAINRFVALANMVTMATIDQDKISCLEVPLPPMKEQNKIVAYLDNQTSSIDNLAVKIRDSINKLQEYRTALISAAVTGKIDVREEVA